MRIILDAMGGDNAPLAPVMGAVQAAKFMAGKPAGFYDMSDVIGGTL